MANVEWDETDAPAGPRVQDVVTERGAGTGGGAHSTAFVLFEWAAINAVHLKNFADAVAGLIALSEAVTQLPGYQNASDKSAMDAEINRIKAVPDYANPAMVKPYKHTQVLQRLLVEYMELRNKVPGTYINGKSGTKGIGEKSERAGVASMKAAWLALKVGRPDHGGSQTKKFAKGMAETFDNDALPAGTGPLIRFSWGRPLAQHVLSAFQAWPGVPDQKKGAIQKQFVALILKQQKVNDTRNDVLGLVGANTRIS